MSDIRRQLKAQFERLEIVGKKMFEVWINEDAPPAAGTEDSWEHCLKQVQQCDILLVLSNGNAGWAKAGGDIGICHAELMTGLARSPGKVRLISLGKISTGTPDEKARNARFQTYVDQQSLFRGADAKTVEQLNGLAKDALHDALISLAQHGVREVSKGKFHSGQALDWSRMDFSGRRDAMVSVVRDALVQRTGAIEVRDHVAFTLGGQDILLVLHAIPAALTVSQAREMVGQPFLHDHELVGELAKKRGGPVHVIACHKSVTESQATRLLGFPDATLVNAPFGVYVADNVQKVQLAFIANCRDDTNTRHGVQRFLEWLNQTGEAELMARRAKARAKIVRAIAEEVS